jgi:hypothetical protein
MKQTEETGKRKTKTEENRRADNRRQTDKQVKQTNRQENGTETDK